MNLKSLMVLTASIAVAFGAVASEVKKGDKDSDGTIHLVLQKVKA